MAVDTTFAYGGITYNLTRAADGRWTTGPATPLATAGHIPRLDTDANKALAPASQLDVLGNTLAYYGSAPYDLVLNSGTVKTNGTDNEADTGITLNASSRMVAVGRYVSFDGVVRYSTVQFKGVATRFYLATSGGFFRYGYGASNVNSPAVADTDIHTFDLDAGVFSIDGVEIEDKSATSWDPTTDESVRLGGNTTDHGNFEFHNVKIYQDGTNLTAEYHFAETSGTTAYDVSGNGNHGTWSGSTGSLHTTSDKQYPYNNANGYDLWIKDSDSTPLYVPLVDGTTTSIKGSGDTITGYTWSRKYTGDDTALNGSETTVSQMPNASQVAATSDGFTTDPFFDGSGDPIIVEQDDIVTDYESSGLYLNVISGDIVSDSRVESVPRTATTDKITSDGDDVGLPVIARTPQAGMIFDLIERRIRFDRKDLMSVCRGLDEHVISHSCAFGSARDLYQSVADASAIKITGSGTIERLQFGYDPIIGCCDSQGYVYPTAGVTEAEPIYYRLGGLMLKAYTDLTYPRMWIIGGGSGRKQINHIQGEFFENPNAGEGDLIELLNDDSRLLWFFGGPGLNDVVGDDPQTYGESEAIAEAVKDSVDYMCGLIQAANQEVMIAGLPPFSRSLSGADEYTALAVRLLTEKYAALALARSIPFYQSWRDMVQSGTAFNTIPVFNDPYTQDATEDGAHYSSAGGTVVRPLMAYNYENDVIDTRETQVGGGGGPLGSGMSKIIGG
jgi:hypothetical protein